MSLNIIRIIRRFRELTNVITTALTAGNNGKSVAMTKDSALLGLYVKRGN